MSLTVDEVKEYISEYVKHYPVARYLNFKVRDSVNELYGEELAQYYQDAKAGYKVYTTEIDGLFGRIDIVANRTQNLDELHKSLNHEILGHYGLNTFTPSEKKLILDSIISHKTELSNLWEYVEKHYANEPLYLKAEEVFCLVAEEVAPALHRGKAKHEFSLNPLTIEKLQDIVLAVAEGIAYQARFQQTFLHQDVTHLQYQLEQSRNQFSEIENEIEDDLER